MPTVERRTWPGHASVLSLMRMGFTYAEAWELPLADYRKYAALWAAESIPPDEREGAVAVATQADINREFGSDL